MSRASPHQHSIFPKHSISLDDLDALTAGTPASDMAAASD
jgi:hypothetical protein